MTLESVNYLEVDGRPRRVNYLQRLDKLPELASHDLQALEAVTEEFAFRSNDYYNGLIDWNDPDDPLRRLIVPQAGELADWGELDASGESLYQPVQGLEHKYRNTALLLCNDTCAAYCRFCFRKRLFQEENDEVAKDVSAGIAYIAAHPEIDNVLLTGGDPLILSTNRLRVILSALMKIPHVRIVRVGTKIPAFNPFRVLSDPSLLGLLESCAQTRQIYVMAHFNHPRELTTEARHAVKLLMRTGATVLNQTPIIRGVNDSAETLERLFNELTFCGVQPYYVFGCRPTRGNLPFAIPVESAFQMFDTARTANSGLAKTARFILSHRTGKVEIVSLSETSIQMRYHNAVDAASNGRTLTFKRNPQALWLDDYV